MPQITHSRPRKSQSRLKPVRPRGQAHGLNETARKLVELMVWSGLDRDAAAGRLGISKDYGYRLMRDVDVMAHYRAECDGLRTSGMARMIYRLEDLAEQDDNKNAAVGAIKGLLNSDEPNPAVPTGGVTIRPGYVLDCRAAYSRSDRRLDERPNPLLDTTLGYKIVLSRGRSTDTPEERG